MTAIKTIRSRSSLNIIVVFFLLFGLSFNPINEKEDSYRYAQEFKQFQKDPKKNIKKTLRNYDVKGENLSRDRVKDLYVHGMYYISSKIGGDNVHVLFFLFAAVFTFFCIGSLKFIIYNKNFQYCIAAYILLFLFFYSNSIFNINGVRFWTASWAAIYISFHILINNQKKWFWALIILPLIHIGFIFYILIFGISYLIKNKIDLLFKIIIISFFLGQVGFVILQSVKSYLPPLLQNLIWSYTESKFIIDKANNLQNESAYAIVLTSLPRYYEILLIFLIGLNRNKLCSSQVLGFSMAYFSIINIFAEIPSLGTRYYMVGYPFIIYLWINNLSVLKKYNYVVYLAPIVYSYVVFRLVRNILYDTPILLYLSNFFHIVIKFIVS